jgi:hypothetical protein
MIEDRFYLELFTFVLILMLGAPMIGREGSWIPNAWKLFLTKSNLCEE